MWRIQKPKYGVGGLPGLLGGSELRCLFQTMLNGPQRESCAVVDSEVRDHSEFRDVQNRCSDGK